MGAAPAPRSRRNRISTRILSVLTLAAVAAWPQHCAARSAASKATATPFKACCARLTWAATGAGAALSCSPSTGLVFRVNAGSAPGASPLAAAFTLTPRRGYSVAPLAARFDASACDARAPCAEWALAPAPGSGVVFSASLHASGPAASCSPGTCAAAVAPAGATARAAGPPIAATEGASCALLASGGGVACGGTNRYGQLGSGTTETSVAPTPVVGLTGALAVAMGEAHACALQQKGTVVCWGRGDSGQVGSGRFDLVNTKPVAVKGVAHATAIAAGGAHTLALASDGRVACWGACGLSKKQVARPAWVPGAKSVVAVAAAGASSCVIVQGGGVQCWGDNQFGTLGDGTTASRSTLAPVPGVASAIQVSAGARHACALLATGAVYCWGDARAGAIPGANGDVVTSPVQIATGAAQVACGGNRTCIVKADGTPQCWGGANASDDPSSLGRVSALAASTNRTCAVRPDGSVACTIPRAGRMFLIGPALEVVGGAGSAPPPAAGAAAPGAAGAAVVRVGGPVSAQPCDLPLTLEIRQLCADTADYPSLAAPLPGTCTPAPPPTTGGGNSSAGGSGGSGGGGSTGSGSGNSTDSGSGGGGGSIDSGGVGDTGSGNGTTSGGSGGGGTPGGSGGGGDSSGSSNSTGGSGGSGSGSGSGGNSTGGGNSTRGHHNGGSSDDGGNGTRTGGGGSSNGTTPVPSPPPGPTPALPEKMGMWIPFYAEPSAVWDRLIAAGDATPCLRGSWKAAVLTGPGSGPPDPSSKRHRDYFSKVYNTNEWTTMGYISTRWGAADLQALLAQVDAWLSPGQDGFGDVIQGIWVDATPPTFNATQRAYYDAIIDRIRGWRKLVAFNPGQDMPQESCDMAAKVDFINAFENTYERWGSTNSTCTCHDKTRCVASIHAYTGGGSGAPALSATMAQAHSRGFDAVFITDRVMPKHYDDLPSFWSNELLATCSVNVN